jgi:sec-independent protein translocase protein TatC
MSDKDEIHKHVMPFGEHLEELRRRLLFAAIPIFPLIVVAWLVRKITMPILMAPMEAAFRRVQSPVRLLATGPLETFMAYLKMSLILSLLVGAPWGLYQLWMFVAPGLYNRERRFIYLLAPLSVILTALGALFMYWVMLPLVLVFCLSFAADVPAPAAAVAPLPAGVALGSIPVLDADPELPAINDTWINRADMVQRTRIGTLASGEPQIAESLLSLGGLVRQEYRVSEYLGLLTTMSLAFAVSFQLPVVVLLLGWAGIITPALLAKYRRHAIFACLILGAVVSPTGEPVASTAMAAPLYVLYELGLLLLRALPASRVAGTSRRSADATAGDE